MRSRFLSGFSVVSYLFLLLLPTATGAQEVVDLPGKDIPIAVDGEEVFSVGSIEGEDWETFAKVDGVAFDAEGNLYIMDAQNSRVVKVGSRGQFMAELGHMGFTVFNPDGSFKTTARIESRDLFIPNGGLQSLPSGAMVDGGPGSMRVVIGGLEGDPMAPRPVNLYTLSKTTEITTAFEAWNPLSAVGNQREEAISAGGFQITSTAMRAFDAGLFVGVFPDGRLAVADSTAYAVKMVEPGQGVIRTLRRPFTPREVTKRDQEAERNRQLKQIADREDSGGGGRSYSSDGGGPVAISSGRVSELLKARVEAMEFGEEIPVLAAMVVDWSGQIWVERTGPRVGEKGPIDLISPEGSYLGSVAPGNFQIPDAFGPNGLAAYIETDEMDVPRVVVKRLKVG